MTKTNAITIVTIIITLLLMPLIAGCASRTPEQTVSGFFTAIGDENYNKAKTFVSTRMKNEDGASDADYEAMGESTGMDGEEIPYTDIENLVSEMDGENAIVWHKDFEAMKWVLVKEGGQWKIDDVDLDFGDMFEGLEDMMPEDFEMPEGMDMPGGVEMPSGD